MAGRVERVELRQPWQPVEKSFTLDSSQPSRDFRGQPAVTAVRSVTCDTYRVPYLTVPTVSQSHVSMRRMPNRAIHFSRAKNDNFVA